MSTQLWWVRPETIEPTAAALALLNPQERAQQQRFIPPAKRHEYLVTRVLVRTVLGEMLRLPPESLSFVHNEWGCPALAPALMPSPIYFNISHTDGLVVCLVSTEYQVGVDTEQLARAPALLALAPRVFAPEEQCELAALPPVDQAQRAVHLWTLKESYIKARGKGLAIPLRSFAFHFKGSSVRLQVEPELMDDGTRWQFQTRTLGGHVISCALAMPDHQDQYGGNKCMEIEPVSFIEF